MNQPDPFDIVRQSLQAVNDHNELLAARAEIARLRQELAEAQENYHVLNEHISRLLKDNAAKDGNPSK